jgi:hypothetical protein
VRTAAFVFGTPCYGFAARDRHPVPLAACLATHPAPEPLIAEPCRRGTTWTTCAVWRPPRRPSSPRHPAKPISP